MAGVDFGFCGGDELVEEVVGFDAEALAAADFDVRFAAVFVADGVAEFDGASRGEGDHLVGEVGVVVGGFGVAHAAEGGDDVILRIVLARVDDVVDVVGVAEEWVRGFAVDGGDPAGVRWVLVEFCVAEVFAGEEAELPEVVGDVFADVGDGAVGADDDFGVFIGEVGVGSLFGDGCFSSCSAHDPAVFILAGGLFIEDAFFDHERAGCVPEVEGEDFAFAGEEVVLDAEALHGFEMATEDGSGDEVGYFGGFVIAGLEGVEGVEANLLAGGDLVRVGGVPLRDAGVEVPAVEVDALVGLEEFGEELAGAV